MGLEQQASADPSTRWNTHAVKYITRYRVGDARSEKSAASRAEKKR